MRRPQVFWGLLGNIRAWIVFLVLCLVLWKWFVIYRTIRLQEWNVYRWSCFSDGSTPVGSLLPPSENRIHTNYISHHFHPLVGLGNLLFMYAAMYGMAQQNGLLPAIPYYPKLHDVMHLDPALIRPFDLSDCRNLVFGQEGCCTYDESSRHLAELHPGRNVSMWGYFQSYRYFHPEYRSDILRHFTFKQPVLERAKAVRLQAVREAVGHRHTLENRTRPIVGVHVRRGDVLAPESVRFGHTTATKNYYIAAADYLRQQGVKDPIFIVCTNDMDWAKQNLPFDDVGFVHSSSPEVDLSVLSQSDHLILSAGTYSFFAGYLSSAKHITYYAYWPRPGSDFAKMTNLAEFWLPEWIPLK